MADQTLAQDRALSTRLDETRAGTVCAVTVTYGNRQHLVRQVLLALLRESAIRKVVVVSNGAQWGVQVLARDLGPGRIEVIDLQSNRGSAAGFAAGIKRACELGTDFIWLLDDDNEPQEGSLSELLAAYAHLRNDFPEEGLAVLAFRPDHQPGGAVRVPPWSLKHRRSSFWGFHIFNIPSKLWRRARRGRPQLCAALPTLVEMAYGPYGGLLFHRAVVEKHGLPREDFVLYGDDTEFAYRITREGGVIWLVTCAEVADLEASWHIELHLGSSFQSWLNGRSDMRAFYGARNQTYLDSHCFPRNQSMFWVNRRVYCLVLWLLAFASRRLGRYTLLQSAIRDGLAERLGAAPNYPF